MRIHPIAFCQENFPRLSFEEICKLLHSLGYDGIEIAPFMFGKDVRKLDTAFRQNLTLNALNYDIDIVGAHWLLVTPEGLHITTPNDEIFRKTQHYFQVLMEFIAEIGGRIMVFGSPNQRNIESSWDAKSAYNRGVYFFQEMGDLAGDLGITIAFEPLGDQISNFGGTYSQAKELLSDINHRQVKLHLDVNAMLRDPLSLEEQIQQTPLDLLAHVHLNDPSNLGPGMGEVDFFPILQAFEKLGYEEWYSIEPFAQDVEGTKIAKESFAYLEKIAH